MTSRYFVRAVKYFLWLVVLFFVLFALMILTGTSKVGFSQGMELLLGSKSGWFLMTVVVVLSLTYPGFGYIKKYYRLPLDDYRDKVMTAFSMSGFILVSESNNKMVFRAEKIVKKAAMFWEDITVEGSGNYIEMEGNRRELVKVDYRFRSLFQ